jgi:hypothetical protein
MAIQLMKNGHTVTIPSPEDCYREALAAVDAARAAYHAAAPAYVDAAILALQSAELRATALYGELYVDKPLALLPWLDATTEAE